MTVRAGDWIRFYHGGNLVIAEVRYVRMQEGYPYKAIALTDIGEIAVSRVIECRSDGDRAIA